MTPDLLNPPPHHFLKLHSNFIATDSQANLYAKTILYRAHI